MFTTGLLPVFSQRPTYITEKNALTIVEYIQTMKAEINLSNNYRRDRISLLCTFSKFHSNSRKEFKDVTREDIILFLESYRRPEASDM
jgi:hypothetical protein